ncbi:4-hydroxy-tetrahydrodipicolinate reductase [bacterium]|nr:4-hydroxy-tetrahydrodipicolinate reductase [FCB group bacterium]MBL7191570.1 4-hydroxy-tetrahydrodipicolinate reductase [bacterium]
MKAKNYIDNPIKVTLFGAGGRMGGETAELLSSSPEFRLVNLIERKSHPLIGSELYGCIVSDNPDSLPMKGTIFCDFTLAEAAVKNAETALIHNCPILIGATGFNEEQFNRIERISESIPVMLASNLSRGISVMKKLAARTAYLLGEDFGAEIVEMHHKWKKDAPSGTAKELLKLLKDHGIKGEVPTHYIRLGDIVGEHRIIFACEGETIEIIHRAHSRKAFAQGVPLALKFLAEAEPGLHSFQKAVEK